MPRIRNVKPSIWKHEVLHDAEYYTGLPLVVGFISLWTSCDREGRFKWKVRSLKSDCMPLRDDVNFGAVLDCLNSLGLVTKLSFSGEYYGVVDNFIEHQAISTSEKKSGIIDLSGAEIIEPLCLDEIMEFYNLKSLDSSRFPEGQTKDRLMPVVRQTTGCQTKDIGHRTKDVKTKDKGQDVAEAPDLDFQYLSKLPKKYHEDTINILDYWAKLTNIRWARNEDSDINRKRAKLIVERLKEGKTLDDCFRAIDGLCANEWYVSKNRTDIRYIFTAEKFDDHINSKTTAQRIVESRGTSAFARAKKRMQGQKEVDITPLAGQYGGAIEN